MPRGRWKETPESLAQEAYCVLIRGDRAQRTMPKTLLRAYLAQDGIKIPFLKYCMEFDDTPNLDSFRKGLLMVVQSLGTTKVAKAAKIHRVTMYRMLAKGGNPSLGNLMRLLTAVGARIWVLEQDFFYRRSRVIRPKDVGYAHDFSVSTGRRVSSRGRGKA